MAKTENPDKKKFDKDVRDLIDPNYKAGKFGYNETYFSESEFEKFVEEMESEYKNYYLCYMNGDGGELESKGGNPPKMACVASSSRFIYTALRYHPWARLGQIEGFTLNQGEEKLFCFEKKLQIKTENGEPVKGATPNLDAAYILGNHSIYIEAKMHEIFDCHYLKWSKTYLEKGLFSDGERCMKIDPDKISGPNSKDEITIDRTAFGLKGKGPLYLDLKQLVCHLLGIANDDYKERELIYLLHKPDGLKGDYSKYYEGFERQFETIANNGPVADFCRENRIALKLIYVTNDIITDGKPLEVRRVYPKGE